MPKPCILRLPLLHSTFMCCFQYFKGTTGNIPLAHTDVRMMPLKWKIRPLLFSKCSSDSLLTCSKRQSWVQTPGLSSVYFSNCISWPHPLSPMPWPSRWYSAALGRLSLLVLACTSSPKDLNGSLSPPRSDLFWSHSWKEHPWTPTVLCISHLPSGHHMEWLNAKKPSPPMICQHMASKSGGGSQRWRCTDGLSNTRYSWRVFCTLRHTGFYKASLWTNILF